MKYIVMLINKVRVLIYFSMIFIKYGSSRLIISCYYKVNIGKYFISQFYDDGKIIIKGRLGLRNFISLNVSGELIFEDNVFLNSYTSINCRSKVTIKQNSILGEGVRIYDHDHNYKGHDILKSGFLLSDVTIGSNVWIGSNVVILRGVNIGDNCVIAAGAIVNKNIPNNTLYLNRDKMVEIND